VTDDAAVELSDQGEPDFAVAAQGVDEVGLERAELIVMRKGLLDDLSYGGEVVGSFGPDYGVQGNPASGSARRRWS
jgi:hypothetical protein